MKHTIGGGEGVLMLLNIENFMPIWRSTHTYTAARNTDKLRNRTALRKPACRRMRFLTPHKPRRGIPRAIAPFPVGPGTIQEAPECARQVPWALAARTHDLRQASTGARETHIRAAIRLYSSSTAGDSQNPAASLHTTVQ